MNKEKIRALLVEPFAEPREVFLEPDDLLSDLQRLVGGYIDCISLTGLSENGKDEQVDCIFNDCGKINGLCLPNRSLTFADLGINDTNKVYDIIYGNMVVVGVDGENWVSINDANIEKFSQRFAVPELFFNIER